MTENHEKSKPRRRGRRGGKGRRKTETTTKPVQMDMEDYVGKPAQPEKADPYDEAAASAEIKTTEKKHEMNMLTTNEQLADVLPLLLRDRDLLVLDWVCGVLGQTRAQVVKSMLTKAIVVEKRAYREAQGGGGASSTDIASLSARLTPRK
ncbi:MAG: hypothetical protein KTR28_08790 [Micavibrio sp.]|nr:hypothetical protein [Micavibrio sp.]